MSHDTVWIPAVPLPFQGWRTDHCGACGKRFRGKGRRAAYELHYRAEHQWGENSDVQMEVSRDEAAAILIDVLAYQAQHA